MLLVSEEVREALVHRHPVVALESTIIAHGMPYPENLAVAAELEQAVRAGGAVPATIALMDGAAVIGLDARSLERLAAGPAEKIATRDIGWALASSVTGATTVSATMVLAAMAGIRVFATGGIGGVHRGDSGDESADLLELSRTQVAVVSAGAKAILDLPRTLERLEALSVPVIGYKTRAFPAFYSVDSGLEVPLTLDSPEALARMLHAHWSLPQAGGVLIANPVPASHAIARHDIEPYIERALQEASPLRGKDLTPSLLKRLNEATKGRSQSVNRKLAVNNASLAASVAGALVKELS